MKQEVYEQALKIIGTQAEPAFENLTELAANLMEMPMAFICLGSTNTYFVKSKFGCASLEPKFVDVLHTSALSSKNNIYTIEDVAHHHRFKNTSRAIDDLQIASCYSIPLRSGTDVILGTLNVLDTKKTMLSENQLSTLLKLAKNLEVLVELQSKNILLGEHQTATEEIIKEKEEFTYMAVHDLKAPIRAVNSLMQLLDQKHKDTWDDKDKKYVSFLYQSNHKMLRLVQDLLEYHKDLTKKENFEALDVQKIIQDVFNDLSTNLKDRTATLTCTKLPTIHSCAPAMKVLFYNLLDNAIKYQPDQQNAKIEIEHIKNDTNWIFSIRDNGIGIEPIYYEEIFKPLKRLHSTSKYEGSGLGLAICRKIMKELQGNINVSSVIGKESTFTLTFPKK